MDRSKYIKKCPLCCIEIETKRYATKGDDAFGSVSLVSDAFIGLSFGGSVGVGLGALVLFTGKKTIITIEDFHDMNS